MLGLSLYQSIKRSRQMITPKPVEAISSNVVVRAPTGCSKSKEDKTLRREKTAKSLVLTLICLSFLFLTLNLPLSVQVELNFTPPRNRGVVIFSLQFVSVCESACVSLSV